MQDDQLWTELKTGDGEHARNELIVRNMGLVHHVARRVGRSSRVDADLDELVSAGTIGLMSAIENFDPSRGLAFSTFAAPRIRGAVLDDLRRRDHVPRSIRRKQRDIARAREELGAALGRAPKDDELAAHMEIDVDKLWTWQRQVELAARVSLDRPLDPTGDEGSSAREVIAGDDGRSVDDAITVSEEIEVLRERMEQLKEQERIVLSLYYFEELKLHQIATILGVTESRISQIRTKALRRLGDDMAYLRKAS